MPDSVLLGISIAAAVLGAAVITMFLIGPWR
jgi:hypothetical protein